MIGPTNLRVYGLLVRGDEVLIAQETVAGKQILKFPGGGVELNETPERALKREFMEECGLSVEVIQLLHVPGTLFSPWTHTYYTPIYYKVDGKGSPVSPSHEPLTLSFRNPATVTASGLMANPEIKAVRRLFGHTSLA